jgi:carbon storage regulator
MLVLTRKSGEGLWIGDDIRIQVIEVREGQVRIGIKAPEEKGICRDELYERIRELNIQASRSKNEDIDSL